MDGERQADIQGPAPQGCGATECADPSAEAAPAVQAPPRRPPAVETVRRRPRGTPTFIGPHGSEADYTARSEGVRSPRMRRLARQILIAPAEADPESVRLLAAAVLAFHAFGK